MRSTKSVANQILEVEGFHVRFVGRDGVDAASRRVDDYDYARAARQSWTVARWRDTRFSTKFPDFDVEVLDGSGNPVHGKTLLSTVRATYELPSSDADHGSDDGGEPRRPVPSMTSAKASRRVKGKTDGPLGFEATLWAAADKLRGSMDSSEYKHVVLGLVFLKYIDDAFAERRAQLAADLAADGFDESAMEDLLESRDEYMAEGVFWVSPDARWSFLRTNAKQPEIGKLIDNAMDLVEMDNPSLRGVLPKLFSRPALDQRRLGELVDLISGIGLGSAEQREKDVLGRVYEYFLGRFAAQIKGPGGDFYTPRNIVKLLVEMLEPYTGRVYDPCCGSGGMFIQSERFVEAHGGARNDIAVYGQESNDTTWRLGKMNLAIRGIEADLGPRWGDTFHEDLHRDLKADYVLANPPFNISDWGGDQLRDDPRWKYGVPPAGNANFAWLQHIASKLAPRGVAAVVLANGSLTSQQSGEGEIRQAMVEGDLVECIVALPGQLFYTVQIAVSLWFLNRDKADGFTRPGSPGWRDRRGEVLFIDCRGLGVMVDRIHRELTNDEIARIADTYHAWRGEPGSPLYEDVPGFCATATVDRIAEEGFNLTPGRYIETEAPQPETEVFEEKVERLRGVLTAHLKRSRELSDEIEVRLGETVPRA